MEIKFLGSRDVLHRASVQGTKIWKLQYNQIEIEGKTEISVVEFWYHENGQFSHLTERGMRKEETLPTPQL
jgi:hypothetical protein